MNKILQSTWAAGLVGTLMFLLTLVFTFTTVKMPQSEAQAADTVEEPGYSWAFHNPEMDQLMLELKSQKAAMDQRENELNLLAARLQSEREQIDVVTQSVYRIQQQFDRSILRIREAEMANLKKIAKTYAEMAPEEAAAAFKAMDESAAAKILKPMREAQSAPIIAALGKLGDAGAKHAALITERLRFSIVEPTPPATPAATPQKTP